MSEPTDRTGPADESTAQPVTPPVRRPSPSAQAASRARRIGGRPSPGPRPSSGPRPSPRTPADLEDAGSATEPAEHPPFDAVDDVVADGPPSRTEAERLRRQIERLRWVPAQVAGVAALALLVLCAWLSHGVWWGKSKADSGGQLRQQVLAAAKPCVAAIVSYDYRTLPASERAGQACITGAFRNDYTKAMETTVKTLAPQTKTVQVFQVAKAGVERVSPDGKQWVVLLYGQQQVTNSSTSKDKPRLDILNVEATLDRVGGKWLVSSIH